ncbi:MAG: HD domain-containing protein [Nitrososphaerota archaeon]
MSSAGMSWIDAAFSLGAALKELKREGWVRRGVRRPESVADHSYSLALLSMLVAADRGLDPYKTAALAVVHDLAEVLTGDLTPSEKKTNQDYRDEEQKAIQEIVYRIQGRAGNLILQLYSEYSSQSSEEARLVKELDKLEMALQAIAYEREGRAGRGLAEEFTQSALKEITDPEIKRKLQAKQ